MRNPTYHVHALEAQVDGNTGGQSVVHTRTHEQLIGLAKLLAQFARTGDHVQVDHGLLTGTVDLIDTVLLYGDGDSVGHADGGSRIGGINFHCEKSTRYI